MPKIDEVDNLYSKFMRVADTSQNLTEPSSWLQTFDVYSHGIVMKT